MRVLGCGLGLAARSGVDRLSKIKESGSPSELTMSLDGSHLGNAAAGDRQAKVALAGITAFAAQKIMGGR